MTERSRTLLKVAFNDEPRTVTVPTNFPQESYLGEGMMKWPKREFFNIVLVVALAMATIGSIIQINNRVIQNKEVRKFLGLTTTEAPHDPAKPEKPEPKETEKP